MKLVDLTHPLQQGQDSYPGDPELSIAPHCSIATTQYNLTKIIMGTHQGTHLDAPSHFFDDGATIDQMPLDLFYGPARLLRIPKAPGDEIGRNDFEPWARYLVPGAKIIFETGYWRNFGRADYFSAYPSMTQEAARYLAGTGIKLLGMDTPTPSRDWLEVHHILLARDVEIVIVESLTNLDQVPDEFTFIGFPLPFMGRDGSPIRAVALFDD